MEILITLVVILGLALIITVAFLIKMSLNNTKTTDSKELIGDINVLRVNSRFMQQTEIDFMNALLKVLPHTCVVMARVPLKYLAVPSVGNVDGETMKKTVDFCIFNQSDMYPLIVVDLIDSTFEKRGIDKYSQDVKQVLKKIGLPIVNINTEKEYDRDKIKQAIVDALEK